MKGLFGFIFALLLIIGAAAAFLFFRLQETQLRHEKEVDAAYKEGYYYGKKDSEEEFRVELIEVKQIAEQKGYHRAVAECQEKVRKAYQKAYDNGKADMETELKRKILQMEQSYQSQLLELKHEHQEDVIGLRRNIDQLRAENLQLTTKLIRSDHSYGKPEKSEQPAKIEAKVLSSEQRRINFIVAIFVFTVPFLTAISMRLLGTGVKRWRIKG